MIQTKTVDITPMKITLPVIEMSQYDLGRQVIVHMKDGSDWFDLTGYTAKLQGTKPSGFGYTVDGVVDGHDITFASNYDMTSEAGFIPSEVRLTKDGVSLGSLNVILHVEKTPHDVTTTDGSPETIIPEMTELVERAEAAAEVLLDCSAIATTLPTGSSATASYDVEEGVFTFGIPRGATGAKGDTGVGISTIQKTSSSGLVDTYTITYTNGTTTTFTVTNGQNGTGSVADVTQNGVSVLDGTTAKVTVPTYVPVTDNEPYLFRQSGNGLDIHNREHDTLVGGSVAWNQLAGNTWRGSQTQGGIAYNYNADGTFTLNGTATVDDYWAITPYGANTTVVGHKYLIAEANHQGSATTFGLSWASKNIIAYGNTCGIVSATNNGGAVAYAYKSGAVIDNVTLKPMLIDLTQMFGSTIADAIYAMEQSTAGSGVAFFKKLFPNSYYPYSSGELMSVSGVSAHVMRDADNNVVGSYALDSTLTLRGIPKLSNGKLYYDGDTYASDGTVTRRFAIKDLGELNWAKESDGVFYSNATSLGMLAPTTSGGAVANIFCSNGATTKDVSGVQLSKTGIGAYKYQTSVYMYYGDTSVSSGADLKTKLTGVYLVYELATPTTETAEPYTNPQVVDESGTEEYVSTSIVPVGHQTAYPDLFSGDYNDLVNKPTIPSKTSDLTNDSGFITGYTETDPLFTSAFVGGGGSDGYIANANAPDKYIGIANGWYANKQNYPSGFNSEMGMLITKNRYDFGTSTSLIVQTLITETGKIWTRKCESGTWGSWVPSSSVLAITVASFSSLPQTVSNSAITANHVCIKAELGTPSAQTGDWTVTTSAGELTISGSISGSTTATLYLAIKQ